MFQFLAGNLEFLGMRLDYAFNVPSALSLISVYFLLYAVSIKLSGKRSVGFLACLFFTFRSSPSLFSYIADIPQGTSVLDTLRDNISFIGYTTNENWGLWNLNVYCNQRHLAFGLATLLLVLLFFLSQPYDMARRLKRMQLTANVKEQEEKQTTTYIAVITSYSIHYTKLYDIIVIPSSTIPQGITAIISYVFDNSPEENEEHMINEMDKVKTGQVTYAVRDTSLDGKEIRQGDIIRITSYNVCYTKLLRV